MSKKNQQLELDFLIAAKKFLIVGGFGFHRETDVIDLNTNSDMMKSTFGKIPSRRIYSVGGLLGSNPIICGGYSFG